MESLLEYALEKTAFSATINFSIKLPLKWMSRASSAGHYNDYVVVYAKYHFVFNGNKKYINQEVFQNMSFNLYVMVSIPEANIDNVFSSPIILGVFDSKETAQEAWKNRGNQFKNIKAKTVHKYCEVFPTDSTHLPSYIYLWATYYVYGSTPQDVPEFVFMPYANGFFDNYEKYVQKNNFVKAHNPISQKEFCEESDFVFYASNEDIIEKFEINKLVRVPVKLTEINR